MEGGDGGLSMGMGDVARWRDAHGRRREVLLPRSIG